MIENYNFNIDKIPNLSQEEKSVRKKNLDILLAGCGTGKHLVTIAKFKNSKILALDLSLSSLAYAKRKVDEFGYKNIEFLHSDILDLNKLDKEQRQRLDYHDRSDRIEKRNKMIALIRKLKIELGEDV